MLFQLIFAFVICFARGQDFNPRPLSERPLSERPLVSTYAVTSPVSSNEVENAFVQARNQLDSTPRTTGTNQVQPFTAESAHALFQAPSSRAFQFGREQLLFETATNIVEEENGPGSGASAFSVRLQGGMAGESFQECSALFNSTVCDPSSRYRRVDGSCNNLRNIYWGRTLTCFPRLLSPEYSDGLTELRQSRSGQPLPNPREVSLRFHSNADRRTDLVSHMHMQFGQFFDHDVTLTPLSRSDMSAPINCCPRGVPELRQCAAIDISPNDPYFSRFNQRCLSFVRSMPCPFCLLGPRQQLNQNTAFIDGSQIYGPSREIMQSLRTLSGGELRVQDNSEFGPLLPVSRDPNNDECSRPEQNRFCFEAGDQRVNVQPGLTIMHTIFVRHHNIIARGLRERNPSWNDERIFQEARRIVGAQLQMITYNEYLPPILGKSRMDLFGLWVEKDAYTAYDPTVEPTLANEFSTAAFRFGHSQINSLFSERGGSTAEYGHLLRDIFFSPFELYRGRLEPFLRGLSQGNAQKADRNMVPDVTNYLYVRTSNQSGLDLAAINIQRGRDHGIPGYPSYVRFCNGPSINSFPDLDRLMSQENRRILQELYGSVDDIDLFTGGLAENPRQGAILGPTFTCILGIQFYHLKYGDRFYFEHYGQTGSFSPEQLSEIKKTSLAKIICDSTSITEIHGEVMKYPNARNRVVNCRELPNINLDAWRE